MVLSVSKFEMNCKLNFLVVTKGNWVSFIKLKLIHRAGMVGAVGKISAFRPQGPQFDPGSAKIQIFVRPSFPPKPTQLFILPG